MSNKNQNLDFLITTTTLSSGNLAKNELKRLKNVQHRYFPFDVSFLMDKFLNQWKPDRILIVDSEIWPNLILKAKQYKIPVALINARLTAKSFNRWMKFSKLQKKYLEFLIYVYVVIWNKIFFENFDARNIHFKGNIKLIVR